MEDPLVKRAEEEMSSVRIHVTVSKVAAWHHKALEKI